MIWGVSLCVGMLAFRTIHVSAVRWFRVSILSEPHRQPGTAIATLSAGAIMFNLEGETPYFHWTFDKFDDLDQKRTDYGFENSVWKSDVIPS
jgi:hypothetical protein